MNKWLQSAVFYQIYPTSFFDSNNDGIGDFKGIIEKIDYIKKLGVTAVWLNPFYESPFMDGGYDITNYKVIKKCFGDLNDFKNLIDCFHKNELKVIIDLVIGHTSIKHRWFKESSKNIKNRYSDYYIWTDSIFKTYKNKTVLGLYPRNGGYYANYYACQPSLNFGFNNPKESWQMKYDDSRLEPLRNEIIDIMRYWLSFGVDGFRVDMANSLVKDPFFNSLDIKDNEGNIWLWNKLITTIKKDYPSCIFIAEWINPSISIPYCGFDIDFYAHDIPEFNCLIRNESGTNLISDLEKGQNFFALNHHGSFSEFKKRYLFDLKNISDKGAIGLVSGSHDQIRAIEKLTYDDLKDYFVFLILCKNVPFIYYGDEIGIPHNFDISKDGGYIRTGARTPMEWNKDVNAGFSKAKKIYLPISGRTNVEDQEKDPDSLLWTVRNLIKIKRKYRVFDANNAINFISDNEVLIFERTDGNDHIFVCINLSNNCFSLKNVNSVIYSEKFKSNKVQPNGFVVYK